MRVARPHTHFANGVGIGHPSEVTFCSNCKCCGRHMCMAVFKPTLSQDPVELSLAWSGVCHKCAIATGQPEVAWNEITFA